MRSQRGFTSVELLVGVAIAGMILPVVTIAIFQMSRGTTSINTDFVIQLDIDSTSSWFSRDLSQALTTDVLDGASPVNSMRVDWIDQTGWALPGQELHYAKYYIEPGTTLLKRDYDGTISTVGRYMADIQFSRSANYITIVISSSFSGKAETLTYFVTPRTDGALL